MVLGGLLLGLLVGLVVLWVKRHGMRKVEERKDPVELEVGRQDSFELEVSGAGAVGA